MTGKQKKKAGCVWLVGAGPGDPGLITVAGMAALREAEVVVFDALANRALLAEAPAEAERIDVGKRAKEHRLRQDQINALLVEKAGAGLRVVRLKGGDPYLFGRGGEEAVYLGERGVRCEVIPGVTSGIAGPAMAGIPVTFRQVASTVTFVTGHEDPTKDASAVDYQGLARLIVAGGTVCFYMGVGRLGLIVEQLMGHGVDGSMSAAAVQWGTTWRQRVVRAGLDDLPGAVERAGVGAPAIVVVGAVAGLDEAGLKFFIRRPLLGQRIVVTRTRPQASALRTKLEALGAGVLEAPTIEIQPVADGRVVDAAIGRLNGYDWLILTSANGVRALAERLSAMGLDSRALAGTGIAVVGAATAEALGGTLGIAADFMPSRANSESLGRELIEQHSMRGKRMLILQADIARPGLVRIIEEAGGEVDNVAVYETRRAAALPGDVVRAFEQRAVDWVTFTSASTARNLVALLGDQGKVLGDCRLASIGPMTSQAMRELGLSVSVEAARSDIDGLVEAIVQAAKGPPTTME